MSLQSALRFIQKIRETDELAVRIRALGPDVVLQQIVEIGLSEGYDFTADDLRAAHAHDWSFRWIRYRAESDARAD